MYRRHQGSGKGPRKVCGHELKGSPVSVRQYLSGNIGSPWVWEGGQARERGCFCKGRGLCMGSGRGRGFWQPVVFCPGLALRSRFVLVSACAWGAPLRS